MVKTFYTLKEVLEHKSYTIDWNDLLISKVNQGDAKDVITALTGVASPGAPFTDGKVDTLVMQYILPRFLDEYVVCVKDDEALDDKIKKFARHFCNIIKSTFSEYSQLISFYDNNRANLLDKLSNTTTTRFNDTPENGGEFEADSYTSNFTKITTESDPGSLISRLDEVRRKLVDIYDKWCNEFVPLTFYEVM